MSLGDSLCHNVEGGSVELQWVEGRLRIGKRTAEGPFNESGEGFGRVTFVSLLALRL